MQLCNFKVQSISKTTLEIHRELLASGVFARATQKDIALRINVNQGTVSRIAAGQFKRINKSVLAVCKYAEISTIKSANMKGLRLALHSQTVLSDPKKQKLVNIIGLAMDLLERS